MEALLTAISLNHPTPAEQLLRIVVTACLMHGFHGTGKGYQLRPVSCCQIGVAVKNQLPTMQVGFCTSQCGLLQHLEIGRLSVGVFVHAFMLAEDVTEQSSGKVQQAHLACMIVLNDNNNKNTNSTTATLCVCACMRCSRQDLLCCAA